MPSERTMYIMTKILMVMLGIHYRFRRFITVFPFVWSALLSTRDRSSEISARASASCDWRQPNGDGANC
ncbi:hypothetical protein OH492_14095 [Vibrio chagasii]|nr:hypothetical protein [Vibrio chagasii]